MDLKILLGRPNVNPVSLSHVGLHPLLVLKKRREDPPFERIVFPCWNRLQNFWLENIGSCIDGVTSDFLRLGFFQKTSDPAVAGGLHQAVSRWILNPSQNQRGGGFSGLMMSDDFADIQLA